MSAAAEGKARSARRRAIESGRHVGDDMAGWRNEAAMSAAAKGQAVTMSAEGPPRGANAPPTGAANEVSVGVL